MKLILAFWLLVTASGYAAEIVTESVPPPFQVTSQGHLMLVNSKDPDDPSAKAAYNLLHENRIATEFREFQGEFIFSNRWNPTGAKESNSYFTVEKKALLHTWSNGQVIAGDSHQELGRGIALALYRDSTFGVDNTLEGISVKQTFSPVTVGAIAGRINTFKNPVALNPVSNSLIDRDVWLASGQLATKIDSNVTLGSHYLYSVNRTGENRVADKVWQTAGLSLQWDGLFDAIDIYGETNGLTTTAVGGNRTRYPTGWGSYLSTTWSEENWRVKFEGKDYRQYHFDFRRPPTLEDDVVVTLNTQDVIAGRIAVERRLGIKTSVFSSFLAGTDRTDNGELRHGILGGKFLGPLRTAWEAKVGYRVVIGKSNLSHAGLKMKLPTLKGQSVELEFRKQLANTNLNTYRVVEDRNQTFLTYNLNEMWNMGVGYEFVPTNPLSAAAYFVNLSANYKTGPLGAKAFLGQTSGGTLCSGGVCRQVTPFSGAYLEGTYTF